MPRPRRKTQIDNYTHGGDSRRNIPTAEVEPVMDQNKRAPIALEYERSARNTDIDPQLVWRGKDEQDWNNLVVTAPPIFIQEKVHPRALINDLIRQSRRNEEEGQSQGQTDLFADFNGLDDPALRSDYYNHEQNWSNRMILGDSLQVMASLASREGLQGRVQCIYIDPPYGLGFNSNFQWSTTSRDVRDGNRDHITREPEQVKAFRDTWRDGIHSYLTYLRDRLTLARDLLADSGSIFVQIGDENVHRVRALMDEVFGSENSGPLITFETTTGQTSRMIAQKNDFLLWYCKDRQQAKFRQLYRTKVPGEEGGTGYRFTLTKELTEIPYDGNLSPGDRVFMKGDTTSQRQGRPSGEGSAMHFTFYCDGKGFTPRGGRGWTTTIDGMSRLRKAYRLMVNGINLAYRRFLDDSPVLAIASSWQDTGSGFMSDKSYVVQTNRKVMERCILMTTDPGDLVLDPTCGSGTTAYAAEQWGRRWITIDTSRVALALARARIMGARYPYYLLADSREGQLKEAEISRLAPPNTPAYGKVRQGFVYDRVPHITLRAIANNTEIDTIYEDSQEKLEPLREAFNETLKTSWEEWEIPREAEKSWPKKAKTLHQQWWDLRIARQKEIDTDIAARADFESLYDKPYEDRNKVRVAGPFTVESLSPHRLIVSGDVEEPTATTPDTQPGNGHQFEGTAPDRDFAAMILENLRTSGVQQPNKDDRIEFESITGWPGEYICAEGQYTEGGTEKRAGIFVGPEFGTVGQPDITAAAREAGQARFDVLIACAFSYDAHATELNQLGALPILKARMNADLHMSADLKNTGQGNLFVVFGEPDVSLEETDDGNLQVRINGVDIYDPSTGQVRSDDTDGIACWFIDIDYDEESFFVRHAYFLGANDPYKSLKITLKAEIDEDAWASLNSDISRPFPKPASGRIAVKVINHLGDEAMKVIRV